MEPVISTKENLYTRQNLVEERSVDMALVRLSMSMVRFTRACGAMVWGKDMDVSFIQPETCTKVTGLRIRPTVAGPSQIWKATDMMASG